MHISARNMHKMVQKAFGPEMISARLKARGV